jgi:hypothetical protein
MHNIIQDMDPEAFMKSHLHKYRFECRNVNGHNHRLVGYAGGMLGIGGFHFHYYYGVSSYRSHTHYFCGLTGMPVKTDNGHVHRMEGILENNDMHEHIYKGYTFEEISYISAPRAIGFVR